MVGIISPSIRNIPVLKAFCLIKRTLPVVDSVAVHVGKLSAWTYTNNPTIEEYVDETQGIGAVADAAITQQSGRFKMTLNEFTTFNVGLYDLGTADFTGTYPRVPIFGSQVGTYAQVEVIGVNSKGPRFHRVMTNALLVGEGDLDLITKTYAGLPITGRHLQDQNGGYGYTDWLADVGTIAPTNWTQPYITSDTAGGSPNVFAGGTPAFADHSPATVLTCNTGQWTGGQITWAFQWYNNASNANTGGSLISGAINQNYTPVAGDAGKYLYCTVAATNSINTTTVPSGTTQAVS